MAKISTNDRVLTPTITISAEDAVRLTRLTSAFSAVAPEVTDYLGRELDRAQVVEQIDPDVVGMERWVTYRDEATGREQQVQLVFPEDADISARKVSVMTPIGAALLGVARGQAITFYTREGTPRDLTVLAVTESKD